MCALRRRPWAPLNSAKASAAPRVTTCWTSGREAERGTRVRAGARPGPIILARRLLVKWQTKLRVRIQLSDARRKHVPCSATHLFDTLFFDKRFIRANFCQFMLPHICLAPHEKREMGPFNRGFSSTLRIPFHKPIHWQIQYD